MRSPLTALVLGLVYGQAAAAPPRLSTIDPPAARRGAETEWRLSGKAFAADITLILPFAAEVKGSAGTESASFTIKPALDTLPGVYPVRVRTAEGISNLRLIAVTDVPVVRSKEPNGRYLHGKLDLEQTQRIDWPCVIAGGRLIRDIDAFRFSVKAGQRLVFVTETRRLGLTPDPMLRLLDSQGRTLARAHDTPGLLRDERLDYTFREAGDYFVEVRSFDVGGWTNHYLLKIGPFDYARAVFPLGGRRGELTRFQIVSRDGKTSTIETCVPADPASDHWRLPLADHPASLPWTLASGAHPEVMEDEQRTAPQTIAWPATVNGRIGKPGEEDLYRIAVQPGQHLRIQVEAYQLGSALDGYLLVYDPINKKLLASHDDQTYRGHPDPGLTLQVPPGVKEVIVSLRDVLEGGGIEHGYRLTIERGGPDFYLWLGKCQNGRKKNEENESWSRMDAEDTLNLPIGVEVRLRVAVRRDAKENDPHYNGPIQGYTGPIQLRAVDVPRGVTIKPTVIPAGKTEGEMICIAAADAPIKPFEIVIIGEGTREDGSAIRRIGERKLFLADPQMLNLAWNWRVEKLTCVTVRKP